MYNKDEMILWSMLYSIVTNVGKMDILALSSKKLFILFRESSKLGINVFKSDYSEVIDLINSLGEDKEYEKIKIFFGDFKLIDQLKKQVEVEKKIMDSKKISFLTYYCPEYPKKLRESSLPPYVLYYMGEFPKEIEINNSMAIVGTRKPKNNTLEEFSESIVFYLKERKGFNIGGLAKGCDTLAHKAALKTGVKNIVILGQGLGTKIYPRENEDLSEKILKTGGVLISEIPPSLNVRSIYLLQRNRIQVYLSKDICILETGSKGGTITTLKNAIKEKKQIYIRNIKENYSIFNMKNINKLNYISSYKDIEYIEQLKKMSLFTIENV